MYNRKTQCAFSIPGGSKSTAKKLASWDVAVRHAAIDAVVTLGDAAPTGPLFVDIPLAVEMTFRMARPSGHWSKRGGLKLSAPVAPSVTPDIDKIVRSTLDSITGLIFDNDSRVVELVARKIYAEPGTEGARIAVRKWNPGAPLEVQS